MLEIHSRKSQAQRNKVSDLFREKHSLVMFTSDVSARGMDYPDVTSVIQVGQPADKAQYVHRLGRTARAGKQGSGVLLLADFERGFLRDVKVCHAGWHLSWAFAAARLGGLLPAEAAFRNLHDADIVCR